MCTPLFVDSYLLVVWSCVSANEKEEKFASNDNYVIYLFSDQSFYKGSRIQPAQLSMFHLLWQWSLMLTFLYIARVKQLGI